LISVRRMLKRAGVVWLLVVTFLGRRATLDR
jgi:hypothetical protein